MAKVDGLDPFTTSMAAGLAGKRAEKKKETPKTSLFSSHLKKAETPGEISPVEPFSEAEASELLDAVHEAGDELKRDISTEHIKAYKKAVRDFMHYVVERSYAVEEHSSGRNVLKRKKFTTVAIIDDKLERLAAEVMSSQRDKLEILRRIDEIHGLLVDLFT